MYMQNDIVAAANRGPKIGEPRIDPAMRQAEIEQILARANWALPKPALRKLGPLSLAAASEDSDQRYFAQVRSEPIGNTGIEFRYPIPARDTGKGSIERKVAKLVEAAVRTAEHAARLRKLNSLVREKTDDAIGSAAGGFSPMCLAAVGVTPSPAEGELAITIDVEMLGCDLTLGIERVTAWGVGEVKSKLKKLAEVHLARRKTLVQAQMADASAFIDEAAVRIIEAAGLERSAILRLVRERRDVEFSWGGEEGYDTRGALFWVDGMITGYAEHRSSNAFFRLDGSQLTIEATGLPATVIVGLPGRRLRDVIDIDVIPPSAFILDATESNGLLYLDLEISRRPLEQEIPVPRAAPH